MRPVLDPARDLAGATPETLARALLRPSARPFFIPVRQAHLDALAQAAARLRELSESDRSQRFKLTGAGGLTGRVESSM